MTIRNLCLNGLLLAASLGGMTSAIAQNITGPSSSQSPYLLGTQPGVVTKSILTVGDAVNFKADGVTPYRMVGIPDGLGAFDNGDGTFTLLMNHEIPGNGIVRDHGLRGAFVSKWIIDKATLTVLHGEDLIKHAWHWDAATYAYVPETIRYQRFCSADLPALSAFYNAATGNGYNGRIYMNGEESGTEGRAVAHVLDGNSFELPWLGKLAWENSVANPGTGDKTVVAGTDDGPGGQVYFYVGQKTTSSHPVAAAGLAGGSLYGLKVTGYAFEDPATGIPSGTPFTCFNLGDVSGLTGLEMDTNSVNGGVTTFQRPEDGCWDPSNPNDFYFVTTASFTGNSRLWRLRFTDASNPAAGGTISMLINGSEGVKMMDNITINKNGKMLIQEDVGNNAHIGKVWGYSLATGSLEIVAQHDPNRFLTGAPGFLTQDEESSGVIPVDDILGSGWFLMDVQAHYGTDAELVEGGQLVAIHLPPARRK
jgi:hypothetical protein